MMQAFIAPPARIPLLLKLGIWVSERITGRIMLPARILAWYPKAAIGSGVAYSIQNWLEQCFSVIGKDWKRHVRLKEGYVAEYPRLVSDPSTIRSLGWSPKVGFAELARMMMASKD